MEIKIKIEEAKQEVEEAAKKQKAKEGHQLELEVDLASMELEEAKNQAITQQIVARVTELDLFLQQMEKAQDIAQTMMRLSINQYAKGEVSKMTLLKEKYGEIFNLIDAERLEKFNLYKDDLVSSTDILMKQRKALISCCLEFQEWKK